MFCSLPASPKLSRARWHCVKHLPCVLWARPERTFCTRAHYADTPHCRPHRVPSLTPARLPNPARHSPSLQYPPSSPWHPAAPPWQHAGVGSGFRRGRRRPSHQRTTAASEHRPCLSSHSSERVRRRHDTLQLQESGRRRSYLLPPRSQPRHVIKGNPELVQGFRRHQTLPVELPTQ